MKISKCSKKCKNFEIYPKNVFLQILSLFWLIFLIYMPILGFSASLGWFEVDIKIANFSPIYKGKHMEGRGVPSGNFL